MEPKWLFNSFCQRRGGRHAADSAAHCKPSPPHTRRSHDYPNIVSSSSHRRKFEPAPCLRSAYFKPFSSSHLCRSLAVSAGSREPRRQKPVAPVGVETICLQQDEPRSSDSEPLSAACRGSLGKKHPTVLFIPLFVLFNNSNNETDIWSGALVFSRRCSLVASIYSQFYTSLKYIVDWTGALCEGLLLVWRRLLEFLGTASMLCRVKLSGKYCHFQTFLSCAVSSFRVCDDPTRGPGKQLQPYELSSDWVFSPKVGHFSFFRDTAVQILLWSFTVWLQPPWSLWPLKFPH